jgi:hypothetical protein
MPPADPDPEASLVPPAATSISTSLDPPPGPFPPPGPLTGPPECAHKLSEMLASMHTTNTRLRGEIVDTELLLCKQAGVGPQTEQIDPLKLFMCSWADVRSDKHLVLAKLARTAARARRIAETPEFSTWHVRAHGMPAHLSVLARIDELATFARHDRALLNAFRAVHAMYTSPGGASIHAHAHAHAFHTSQDTETDSTLSESESGSSDSDPPCSPRHLARTVYIKP